MLIVAGTVAAITAALLLAYAALLTDDKLTDLGTAMTEAATERADLGTAMAEAATERADLRTAMTEAATERADLRTAMTEAATERADLRTAMIEGFRAITARLDKLAEQPADNAASDADQD